MRSGLLSGRGDVTVDVYRGPQPGTESKYYPLPVYLSFLHLLLGRLLPLLHLLPMLRPQCASFLARRSSAEYSVARLAINSGQLGTQFNSKAQTATVGHQENVYGVVRKR